MLFQIGRQSSVTNEFCFQKRGGKNQGWSGWSEWSTCSRSCDGGVAHQLRRCHSPHGCKGDSVRYKICNLQVRTEHRPWTKYSAVTLLMPWMVLIETNISPSAAVSCFGRFSGAPVLSLWWCAIRRSYLQMVSPLRLQWAVCTHLQVRIIIKEPQFQLV